MVCLPQTALLSHLGGFHTARGKRRDIWLGSESISTTRGMEVRIHTEERDVFKFKTAEGRRGNFEQTGQRKTGREIAVVG